MFKNLNYINMEEINLKIVAKELENIKKRLKDAKDYTPFPDIVSSGNPYETRDIIDLITIFAEDKRVKKERPLTFQEQIEELGIKEVLQSKGLYSSSKGSKVVTLQMYGANWSHSDCKAWELIFLSFKEEIYTILLENENINFIDLLGKINGQIVKDIRQIIHYGDKTVNGYMSDVEEILRELIWTQRRYEK